MLEYWPERNFGNEENTQIWVLEGTRIGSEKAFKQYGNKNIINAPKKLAEELSKKYGLDLKGNIDWERLLIAINE